MARGTRSFVVLFVGLLVTLIGLGLVAATAPSRAAESHTGQTAQVSTAPAGSYSALR